MALHIIFTIFYLLSIDFFSTGTDLFSGKLVSGIFIIHCVFACYNEILTHKKINPLVLLYVNIIVVTFANYIFIEKIESNTVSYYYAYYVRDMVNIAVVIWAIGNTFIFIGFDLFRKKTFPSISIIIYGEKKIRLLYLVMLVLTFRTVFISDFQLGSIGPLLSAISALGTVFFARLWRKYNNDTYRKYALTLYVTQTFFALLYAYLRQDMLMPTIALFIGYFMGDIKEVFSVKIIPFAAIGVVFVTYFTLFGNSRADLSKGFSRFSQLSTIQKQEIVYREDQQSVLDRLSVIPQLSSVASLVRYKGYYQGKASSPLIIALIPRILWPEKPPIAIGAWFAVEIGQGSATRNWFNNSINMTIPGQLYLDFGIFGLMIGAIGVGWLVAVLWNASMFYQSYYNITGMILGGYLLLASINGIGADLQILVTFLSFYLVLLFVKKIA